MAEGLALLLIFLSIEQHLSEQNLLVALIGLYSFLHILHFFYRMFNISFTLTQLRTIFCIFAMAFEFRIAYLADKISHIDDRS